MKCVGTDIMVCLVDGFVFFSCLCQTSHGVKVWIGCVRKEGPDSLS